MGYGIDYRDSVFTQIEENIARQNEAAADQRLKLINELGFRVTAEELEAISANDYWPKNWTGEKFAEIILNKPEYFDHELLKPLPSRRGERRTILSSIFTGIIVPRANLVMLRLPIQL